MSGHVGLLYTELLLSVCPLEPPTSQCIPWAGRRQEASGSPPPISLLPGVFVPQVLAAWLFSKTFEELNFYLTQLSQSLVG